MSIFDRFKKSKKQKKPVKKQKSPRQADAIDLAAPEKQGATKKVEKKQFSNAYRILQSVHVTEKSTMLGERGAYVFKVKPRANKPEIKKAIEDLYGVKVEKVAIIIAPEKFKRLGQHEGRRSGYKKAIVKLVEGEKIEIMPR